MSQQEKESRYSGLLPCAAAGGFLRGVTGSFWFWVWQRNDVIVVQFILLHSCVEDRAWAGIRVSRRPGIAESYIPGSCADNSRVVTLQKFFTNLLVLLLSYKGESIERTCQRERSTQRIPARNILFTLQIMQKLVSYFRRHYSIRNVCCLAKHSQSKLLSIQDFTVYFTIPLQCC